MVADRLPAHLEELEDEKPPELVVTLTDLQGDEHEVDRTELFLTISKAYSKRKCSWLDYDLLC